MRERYPALWQLFAGYFHQDWALDDRTADDVLGRFVRGEPPDAVRRVRRDLEDVLRLWPAERELEAVTDRLGSSYRPAGDGLSTRDWLLHVGQFLERAG